MPHSRLPRPSVLRDALLRPTAPVALAALQIGVATVRALGERAELAASMARPAIGVDGAPSPRSSPPKTPPPSPSPPLMKPPRPPPDPFDAGTIIVVHGPMLRKLIASRFRAEQDAEELFSQVSLWLVEHLDEYDREAGPEDLGAWLAAATRFKMKNYRRTLDKEAERGEELESDDVLEPAPDPQQKLLACEELAQVEGLMEDLRDPDQQFAIVSLHEGLTLEQIAMCQGTTVDTVKSRLARAREKLRAGLVGLGGERPAPRVVRRPPRIRR